MEILSRLFGRGGDSFKVEDLKGISDAIQLMVPLQSYDPKRGIKLKDLIRYPTLAVAAGRIFNILEKVNNKKQLKNAIKDGDIDKENHKWLKKLCDSFTRKIERIEDEIMNMSRSNIKGIREQASQVDAGFQKLKELIPRLAEIVFED